MISTRIILVRVTVFGVRLKQSDGVTCGPSAAIVGGALLDPSYAVPLSSGENSDAARAWFAAEQAALHKSINRVWPRSLGSTPAGVASALSRHSRGHGVRYRWRFFRGRRDSLSDVRADVRAGWPVAMLVGRYVPRHWVLLVGVGDEAFDCYEPSSGEVRPVTFAAIRSRRLTGVGFPCPFAFVTPRRKDHHHGQKDRDKGPG